MQKGKSLKDLFEEDYAAVKVPAANKKGYKIRYLYSGPWYIWNMPEGRLKKEKWLELGLSLVSLILYLVVGMQDATVNISQYGVIPAVIALCIHVLEISALIKFICAKYRTTRLTYQEVDRVLGAATGLRGIILSVTAVIALVYSAATGFDLISIVATAGYVGCAAIAFTICRRYSRITFCTENNHSLDDKAVIKSMEK